MNGRRAPDQIDLGIGRKLPAKYYRDRSRIIGAKPHLHGLGGLGLAPVESHHQAADGVVADEGHGVAGGGSGGHRCGVPVEILPGRGDPDQLGAVGRTAHLNLSSIGSFGPSLLWNEATLYSELAWTRTLSVTKNAAALDPNGTRDGVALRALFEPTYRGVADGLDVGVPVGIGWAPKGARPWSAEHPNAWIPEGGGDLSVGLKFAFRDVWRASLNFTHYYGPAAPLSDPAAGNAYTWKQTLRDRDFLAASLSYSF